MGGGKKDKKWEKKINLKFNTAPLHTHKTQKWKEKQRDILRSSAQESRTKILQFGFFLRGCWYKKKNIDILYVYKCTHTYKKFTRVSYPMPRFWQFVRKKKIITNTFFCCLPCWSMQFYKIKEKKSTSTGTTRFTKKNDGLGGDSLTVTVFSLHFL